MKRSNAADVFNLIRESGKLTRREIADALGMSWGAVSTITSRLIDEAYIIEVKANSTSAKGRTPSALEVNGDEHFAVGLDINRTGLSAVLVNLKNHVLGRWQAEGDFSARDVLTKNITDFISLVLSHAEGHRVRCIGVAMQGVVDSASGVSYSLPGCKDWKSINIASIIYDSFGIPAYIEHDPNCILYASKTDFSEDTLLLRIDKGIGMAATLGGRIMAKSGILEVGHICVVRGGRPCMCSQNGCLEQYASMRGLAKASGMEFSQLASKALGGDGKALAYFDEMAHHLAYVIGNVSHLLCARDVLLCGDMCKYKELFLDKLKANLAESASSVWISFTDVANAPLGAALIAIDRSLEQIDI
jgi:predicted NBD/HSP70 family sugar kinase